MGAAISVDCMAKARGIREQRSSSLQAIVLSVCMRGQKKGHGWREGEVREGKGSDKAEGLHGWHVVGPWQYLGVGECPSRSTNELGVQHFG